MANAMLDPRREDKAYRRVEVIMGQRWLRRYQNQQFQRAKIKKYKQCCELALAVET